jgi:hypothetical protein
MVVRLADEFYIQPRNRPVQPVERRYQLRCHLGFPVERHEDCVDRQVAVGRRWIVQLLPGAEKRPAANEDRGEIDQGDGVVQQVENDIVGQGAERHGDDAGAGQKALFSGKDDTGAEARAAVEKGVDRLAHTPPLAGLPDGGAKR